MAKWFFKIGPLFLFFLGPLPFAFAEDMGAVPPSLSPPPSSVSSPPPLSPSFPPPSQPASLPPSPAASSPPPVSASLPAASPPPVFSPPPASSPTPVSSPPPVSSPSSAASNPPPAVMQASHQFEQWLAANGYGAAQKTMALKQSSAHAGSVRHQSKTKPISFEQQQDIMLHSAPPFPTPVPDRTEAFNNMLRQNMPLSPQQVVRLRQEIDVSQRAAAILPNIPPKPLSTTLMINLAPGTTPPAVRLAQGYVSSLVFVDSTGAPWPIAAFDIGNPKTVNLQWDGKSNILLIQAVAPYSNGDMVIRLVGLPTPITLELVSGQRVVDYRVDIHVSGLGPNAKETAYTALPASANQLLLGVLDGVAPPGSRPLTVVGTDSQAWLLGEKVYLRTRMTVLSPGWTGKMESPDGMLAYELPKTSSVLISRYGEPVELKIEGI